MFKKSYKKDSSLLSSSFHHFFQRNKFHCQQFFFHLFQDTPPVDVRNVSELLKAKKIQPSSLRFGFLGLGIMASGIVKNLINSEHRVNLWCETPSKVSDFFPLSKSVFVLRAPDWFK